MTLLNKEQKSDPFEPKGNIGPDWLKTYLEEGGKAEDTAILDRWLRKHRIKTTLDLSPIAGYAGQDD